MSFHLARRSRASRLRSRVPVAAIAAVIGAAQTCSAATTSNWLSPSGGAWTNPSNWSTGPYYPANGNPAGVTYDAVIGATGSPYTFVTLNASALPQATLAVDSVTLNSPNTTLSLTGGTLQAGRLILNGGIVNVPPESGARLKDTTIAGSGGQAFTGAVTLDHVAVETDLWFYDGLGVTFENGLTLDDATLTLSGRNSFRNPQTISGHGTITMTRPGTIPELTASGGVVTIGSGITLEGGGDLRNSRGGYFVNNGTVRANSDTDWLAFRGGFGGPNVNNGLMEAVRDATGFHTLVLNDIDNTNGVIRAAGGTVIIEQVAGPKVGALETTNFGSITINNIFANTGNTVTLTPASGSVRVGQVVGGTLATTGGSEFVPMGSTWSNVTLAGSAAGGSINADTLTLNNGTIRLFSKSGGAGSFEKLTAQTLAGTGQVVFENSELNVVQGFSARLTLPVGVTVRTGTGGGSVYFADNYGNILSQTAGHTIVLRSFINHGTVRAGGQGVVTSGITEEGLTTNYGTIAADDGGTVTLAGTWNNAAGGTLAAAGGTVNLGGSWSSAGAINVTGGTMNLGGAFTTPTGTYSRSGGTVNVTGALTNSGRTLALGADTGSWNVTSTGKVGGGTLTTAGGASLVGQSTSARLESLNIAGRVDVPVGITLADSSIGNAGSVSVTAGATLNANGSWSNAGTMTADGGTLRLNNNWSNSGTISVMNGGILETTGAWSNAGGTMNATSNALVRIGGSSTNIGAINVTNGGVEVVGSFTTPQLLAIGRTNSTIALSTGGNVLNAGETLTISPAFPLQLKGGTITGGVLQTGGGVEAALVQESVTFDGVTIDTTVNVAPAKTLSLAGSWDNNGVIGAQGATVSLGGLFNQGNIGVLDRNAATTVRIAGTLSNTGSTFAIDGLGTWTLWGGTIDGGTVTAPAGTTFYVGSTTATSSAATLSGGVTLSGNIVVGRTTANVLQGLTLASGTTLTLQGATGSGVLSFAGTQTLSGSGDIIFGGSSSTASTVRTSGAGSVLTIGPGITIRTGTQGGVIGASGTSVINQGLISSRTAGRTISINGTVTNEGTIELRNGGSVVAGTNPPGSFTNYANNTLTGGRWDIGAGSTLAMSNASITTNAADVTLDGVGSNFSAMNVLANNAGRFAIDHGRQFSTVGALTNSGTLHVGQDSMLTVNGTLTNTGTIEGAGSIIAPGGFALQGGSVGSALTGTGSLTKTTLGTAELSGANGYTGGTTVSAGTLVLGNADATAGGAINVANGALARAQAGLTKAVTVTTLTTNTSGKFDLTNNSMVVKGMADSAVRTQLQAGYNDGAWNAASGIITTSITPETSLGYVTQAQTGITSFKGVTSLTGTDVLVKYTYAGDANLDGKVDIGDLGLLAGAWQQLSGRVWFDGDFTYDGAVDIGDLGLLAGNWQKGTDGNPNPPLMDFATAMAQFSAFEGVAVPEPTGLAVPGLGGLALIRLRRRTHSPARQRPARWHFL